MIAEDDEIQALRVVHEHLEVGERVLLFGRCRLKGWPTKYLLLFCLILVGSVLVVVTFPLFFVWIVQYIQVLNGAACCALVLLFLALRGRQFGFCALTDRRLLQVGDEGVIVIALRNEVRQIAGTDNKIMLMVAKVKKDATAQELRLGVKAVQQIELSPVRNLVDLVGGKELLIDQLGSNQ